MHFKIAGQRHYGWLRAYRPGTTDTLDVFILDYAYESAAEVPLLPGAGLVCADPNHDGRVDLSDLGAVLSGYGLSSGATFADGDIDGDGDVDLSDLGHVLAGFGQMCG